MRTCKKIIHPKIHHHHHVFSITRNGISTQAHTDKQKQKEKEKEKENGKWKMENEWLLRQYELKTHHGVQEIASIFADSWDKDRLVCVWVGLAWVEQKKKRGFDKNKRILERERERERER